MPETRGGKQTFVQAEDLKTVQKEKFSKENTSSKAKKEVPETVEQELESATKAQSR